MFVPANPCSPKAVLDYLEAYESAFRREGMAQIGDHVPAPEDPLYLPVLVELVRIDLEHRWEQGRPLPLLEYQRQFPKLFTDVAALQAVAQEEFRQRLAHGEKPSATEYQQLYGIIITEQTAPPVAAVDELVARAHQHFWDLDAGDSAAPASLVSEIAGVPALAATQITPPPPSVRPASLGL